MQFAVFVAYAGRLENAFLADEMASAQAILQMMQWSDPNRATRNEPASEELLGKAVVCTGIVVFATCFSCICSESK